MFVPRLSYNISMSLFRLKIKRVAYGADTQINTLEVLGSCEGSDHLRRGSYEVTLSALTEDIEALVDNPSLFSWLHGWMRV